MGISGKKLVVAPKQGSTPSPSPITKWASLPPTTPATASTIVVAVGNVGSGG
ncbi:hypothetical protein M407DRAFT_242064 [Tulasnella calospora MUT 4182]|uniref:Uncharacterized protein n=1 Tax=Tulasnella calospora MUT 4182 TaxID=1051891 RepID=A0A0C3MAZ2_9AGAM|nr:hypothetical protein M407DRAFT_242064 [Tulasnella calospora MUT 4182]